MKRNTRQKKAIKEVFLENPRPLTVKEIFNYSRNKVETLNQSTVYRNLKLLVSEEWLTSVTHPVLGLLYELKGKEHHHHFFCRSCNRAFDLEGCALRKEQLVPDGFVMDHHEIFIHGTCATCSGNL